MNSIRAKVTVLVLLLGAPFLFAAFQSLVIISEQRQVQDRKSLAKRSVTRMSRELSGDNPRGEIAGLYEQYGLRDFKVEVSLVDGHGTPIWQSSPSAPQSIGEKGVQSQLLNKGALLYTQAEPVPTRNLPLTLGITGIVLAVYGLGGWFLVGRTLRPIAQVVDRVGVASESGEGALKPPTSDREIVDLVAILNDLICKIRRESDERVESYAMLSHELRTPIQSLLGEVDLALGAEKSKEELEETLLDVQRQVLRLNALSEAVLFLQGLSQPAGTVGESRVAVADLVQRNLEALEPLGELRGLDVRVEGASNFEFVAPREHVDILLRNLLENAFKHSAERCRIEVILQGEAPEIAIRNQLSERARQDGNRLGLRICRALAKANGWSLEAGPAGGSFVARVKFD